MSWPLEAALLHAAFFVLGVLLPGAAALALLPPDAEEAGGPRAFLRLAAAGVLWNALLLGVALVLRPSGHLPRAAVLGSAALAGALLVLFALVFRRARLAAFVSAGVRGVSLPLAALALLCAAGALRTFPFVADCVQLRWAERLIAGDPLVHDSGALGFSAWMLFPGLLREDLPLVSSAAGARFPLFLLAFLAAHALVRSAGVRRVAFSTGLFLVFLLASYFGRFGLFELGKDSLFGLVFAMAFAAALPRDRARDGRRDRALFFAAAVLLGVITAPFLAVLALLDLALRLSEGGLRSEVRTLALFVVPASLPALLAMSRIPLGGLGALVAAVAALAFALPEKPVSSRRGASGLAARFWPFLAALALAGAGALLMPERLEITVDLDAAGQPIQLARAPLDGRVPFWLYLTASGGGRYVPVSVAGVAGVLLYLLRPPARRDPSLVAIALSPLVVSLAGLLLARLPAPPLLPFHVWDLVKDVPLWLAGPFWGLFAVLAVDRLLGVRISDWALSVGLTAAVLVVFVAKRKTLPLTFRPAILTAGAGHQNGDTAALCQALWDLRNEARALVVPETSFARPFSDHLGGFVRVRPVGVRAFDDEALRLATARRPALVVADPALERTLAGLLREEAIEIRAVRTFDAPGESLLRIAPAPER